MWVGGCDVEDSPRKPWFDSPGELNIFSLIATKLACRNDGGGRSRCCVLVASTDFFRMRGIEADCSRLKPRARGEYLTSQLSWAAAWLLVTYGSPLHLVVDELLRPFVLCSLMIKLSGSLDVFLTWWVWFYL